MNLTKDFWESLLYQGISIIIITVFGLLVGLYLAEITSTAVAATLVAIYLVLVIFLWERSNTDDLGNPRS